MERLPVVEDLVAVMNDVRFGAHVAEESEGENRQEPVEAAAAVAVLVGLGVLRVVIRRGGGGGLIR